MQEQLQLWTSTFQLTETGLVVQGDPDYEDWIQYGHSLKTLDNTARQFAIGDWIVHGFGRYERGKWETVQEVWGDRDFDALRDYEYVARSIKSAVRTALLPFGHHKIIASLPPDKQSYWLEQASSKGWSVNTLRQKLSESTHIHLYKGDMLEVLPQLGTFDLVITDPPYGVTENEWDELETELWLGAVIPKLAPAYNLFWFCSPSQAADTELIFRKLELPIQSRIVWHRRNMSMGSHSKSKFVDSWEMILHVGNRELNFPGEWSDAWFDVQEFAVPQTNFTDRKLHPTQKPEGLMQRLLLFGSYPGDQILDPFAGAGTSAVVCPDDREITLIEKEEGYVGIMEGRLGIRRRS